MKTVLAIVCMLCLSGFAVGQTVVQVEYFLDTDAGFGKNKVVSVTPAPDGTFPFSPDLTGASAGYHLLYIRTRDSNGQWSHTAVRNVEVFRSQAVGNVVSVEYFLDTDPGVGKAASLVLATPQPNGTFAFVIPKDKTTPGAHVLYVRAKDSPNQNWSQTGWKPVTVVNCTPPDPPTTVASQTVCAGSTATFSIPAVAQVLGYRWAVPTGWAIVSGQGTATVALKAPDVTSVSTFTALSVAAYNACDTGQARLFSATVNALPARPTISISGDTALVSSVAGTTQWFLNGTAIGRATARSYRPLASGQYTVQVIQDGCASPASVAYPFIITALTEPLFADVEVFPNPVTDHVMVMNHSSRPVSLNVYSLTGQQLMSVDRITDTYRLNTESFTAGCYVLLINQGNAFVRKVILK